jgi:hypothetical protein
MRLETMVLTAVEMPVRAIREQIIAAIHLVVQVARFPDGHRRITHISEVVGLDQETSQILTEDIFTIRPVQLSAGGNIHDSAWKGELRLQHTGYVPEFTQDLLAKGLLNLEVFQ